MLACVIVSISFDFFNADEFVQRCLTVCSGGKLDVLTMSFIVVDGSLWHCGLGLDTPANCTCFGL